MRYSMLLLLLAACQSSTSPDPQQITLAFGQPQTRWWQSGHPARPFYAYTWFVSTKDTVIADVVFVTPRTFQDSTSLARLAASAK